MVIKISMDLVARLTLKDDMTSRMKRVTRSLSDVESRTRRATSGFKNLTSSMAGMAGAIGLTSLLNSGMGLLKSSIGKAFDRIDVMERFESTMTLLLGTVDAAKDSLATINEIVTGTAFGLDLAAKSVQAFVSRGIELTKATGWFEAMGDAVTFYGDGSNGQLESVMEAMGKMVSAGKISMMQMNTLFAAGIDAPGIYAKAVGKDVKAVRKALSKNKIPVEDFFDVVVSAMNEGTNGVQKIAGAAKESGATWENVIANMKTAIVRGVMTIIMTIDEMLEKNGLPKMRAMISAFGKAAEKAIKKVAEAIGPVIGAFVKMYNAIKPVVPLIMSLAQAIGIALLAIGSFFAIVGALKLVGAAFMFLFSPIGLIIGAIAGLVLGFKAAYKHSEPFRKAVDGIANAFKAVFSVLSGSKEGSMEARMGMLTAGMDNEQVSKVFTFAHKLKKGFEIIKGAFKILFGDKQGGSDILRNAGLDLEQINKIYAFADGIKVAFDRVKMIFDGIGTLVSGGGSGDLLVALGISPELVAKITKVVNGIKKIVGKFVAYLGAKWAELQPSIAMLLERFVSLKDTAVNIFTTLWAFLQPIFSALGNAFMIIADIAVLAWKNIIAPAIDFVISVFQMLWKIVGPILVLIGEAIGLAFGILKVVWDTILKPVANFLLGRFKTAFEKMKPFIEGLGDEFEVLGGIIETIAGWFGSFTDALSSFKVPNWLAKLGGGGTVTFVETSTETKGKSKYHGIDYVAKNNTPFDLHRGEAVLTAAENKERKQGGFGGGVTVTGNTFNVRQESDINDIADQLYRKIVAAEGAGA